MKIAAVVVTYNRIKLLTECIDAILAQTRSVDTLIVIDNASTDGTKELFSHGSVYDIPVVDYQRMDSNLGGAGGFYEGIKYAYSTDADWVWIMDDDTIPTKTALQELCNALAAIDGKTSFLASSVFGIHEEPMNVPGLDGRPCDNGYPDWYRYLGKGIVKIDCATFVSLLINKYAISKVGFPYQKFFIWGDDSEYTLRMTHHYGPAYMCGMSEVIHKRTVAKSINILNVEDPQRIAQYHYYYRNLLINIHEYMGGTKAVINQIKKLNRLCINILMDGDQKNKLKKISAIHKGIWEYILGSYDKNAFGARFNIS